RLILNELNDRLAHGALAHRAGWTASGRRVGLPRGGCRRCKGGVDRQDLVSAEQFPYAQQGSAQPRDTKLAAELARPGMCAGEFVHAARITPGGASHVGNYDCLRCAGDAELVSD